MLAVAVLLTVSLPAGAECVYRFAWSPRPPLHFIGTDGLMRGIDYELVTEALRRIGCSADWEQAPRGRAMKLLEEGRVDAVAGLSRTEQRMTYAQYSAVLRPNRNVLVVRRRQVGDYHFQTLDDLAATGFRLAAPAGARYSQQYEKLLNAGRFGEVANVGSTGAAATMLLRGRIDGFFENEAVLRHFLNHGDLGDQLAVYPLHLDAQAHHVLFSRQRVPAEAVARFDGALAGMKADGTLARLLEMAY